MQMVFEFTEKIFSIFYLIKFYLKIRKTIRNKIQILIHTIELFPYIKSNSYYVN